MTNPKDALDWYERKHEMATEMKPCPFCGRNVVLEREGSTYRAGCDEDCPACNDNWFGVAEEAIEAWNMRHERTCTYDEGENYDLICSACGWNRRGALNIPNYCPHCGARVENATKEEDIHGRGWVKLNEAV